MNKKIWINKSDSHEEAQEFDVEYYLSMSSKERLETVQNQSSCPRDKVDLDLLIKAKDRK